MNLFGLVDSFYIELLYPITNNTRRNHQHTFCILGMYFSLIDLVVFTREYLIEMINQGVAFYRCL